MPGKHPNELLSFEDDKTRITIGKGLVRIYRRFASKSWTLKLQAPYFAFREVRVVLFTENTSEFAGVMTACLIRKPRMGPRIILFRYPIYGRGITSHDEGWRASTSVSNELGIPITKKEIDHPNKSKGSDPIDFRLS